MQWATDFDSTPFVFIRCRWASFTNCDRQKRGSRMDACKVSTLQNFMLSYEATAYHLPEEITLKPEDLKSS